MASSSRLEWGQAELTQQQPRCTIVPPMDEIGPAFRAVMLVGTMLLKTGLGNLALTLDHAELPRTRSIWTHVEAPNSITYSNLYSALFRAVDLFLDK